MKKKTLFYYLAWFFTVPSIASLFYFRYTLISNPFQIFTEVPMNISLGGLVFAVIFFYIDELISKKTQNQNS